MLDTRKLHPNHNSKARFSDMNFEVPTSLEIGVHYDHERILTDIPRENVQLEQGIPLLLERPLHHVPVDGDRPVLWHVGHMTRSSSRGVWVPRLLIHVSNILNLTSRKITVVSLGIY